MTESRLNDLALIALHQIRLSKLSTEKIIEMFVQANTRKLLLKWVDDYVDLSKFYLKILKEISFISKNIIFNDAVILI